MKVTENKIDNLNLELTLEVAAADYAEIEKKKLLFYPAKHVLRRWS